MNKQHATLSASGAHRWLVCAGSVELEKQFPKTTSDFAEYGTAAHDLAERCLTEDVQAGKFAGQKFNGFEVDSEMIAAVDDYLDYVRGHRGTRFIEQRVEYSNFVPEGFGTCDALVIDGNKAAVIDLKMGKGVRVDAKDNPQSMLYALGALNDFDFVLSDVDNFKLAIVQPRLDHISEYEISRKDLLAFGEYAKRRAALALAPNAEFTPNEKACKFCRAKATCRALAEHNLSIAAEGFSDIQTQITTKRLDVLSNDDIAQLLPQFDSVSCWISAVKAHAQTELENGRDIPGYKLVEGRSVRKWRDEADAEVVLRRSKLKVADIFSKKLISPTQAEKLLGKGHHIMTEQVVRPQGKPIIAPAGDKRPSLEVDPTAGFEKVTRNGE